VVAFRVAGFVFLAALAVDLLTKQWATAHDGGVVFNDKPSDLPLRVIMSIVAIGVAVVLGRFAASRGLGRQWGLWIGVALLVAGTIANGLSALIWAQGVPDFIDVDGGWVWNVADFEIAVGMAGGILSVAVTAVVVYTRETVSRRRAARARLS
jgi:lipoprotein signal peptidase